MSISATILDKYGRIKTAYGIGDGEIVEAKLADGSVTESKLANGAVTDTKVNLHGLFNVLAYGATGDGATEDTTAIQAALDAAKTAGGGRVYLPAGTYLTDGLSLADADYITIEGDGPGRTILKLMDAGNAHVLQFTRCDYLTVRNLEIDGNKSNQTSNLLRGIYWLADNASSGGVLCVHGTFENLYIHDTRDQGLVIGGGRWVKIDKVHTERCGLAGSNIGAGIHIGDAYPDTTLHSCDVQISNCSDVGSGLYGATGGDLEGAGLQLQANTHDIEVTNYTSRDAIKYGIKCQAYKVELNNIQVYDPAVSGIALQYNNVRLCNAYVEKTTGGSAGAIGIGAPQQATDPRDIRMDLANIHIVDTAGGFYTGLSITNSESDTNPVSHVHITNLNISGHSGMNMGLQLAGNVTDCDIVNAHITDCDTNISMGAYTINSVVYGPERIHCVNVHSKELTAGAADSIGWYMGYGSGVLIGCTSTALAGSSRTLWSNYNHYWSVLAINDVASCVCVNATTPSRYIASGALSIRNSGYVEVRAESGTTDDLTDITGGITGQTLWLKAYSIHTITVKHNASKIILPGAVDYTLSGDKRLFLYCISSGLWTVPNA